MKTGKIILTLLLCGLWAYLAFYGQPQLLAKTAVDQLQDTPTSTGNVRFVASLWLIGAPIFLMAFLLLWRDEIANGFKNKNEK